MMLGARSFSHVTQSPGSNIQIYVLRVKSVRVESEALTNLTQAVDSSVEIWTSKLDGNFSLAARAFRTFTQADRSTMRLGYSSSSTSSPTAGFIQSPGSFEKWNSTSTSSLVYDFTQDTNFRLRFPQRPIPRMFISSSNETVEEAAMRLFPNLGRLSRPDTISFNEYQVSQRDFCRLVHIPFDVLVRVPTHSTQCSCTLFYLYRVVRRVRPEWLSSAAPKCYQDLLGVPGRIDEAESECGFSDMVRKCQEEQENPNERYLDPVATNAQCRSETFEFYKENTLGGGPKGRGDVTTTTTLNPSVVNNNDLDWSDDDENIDDDGDDDEGPPKTMSVSVEYEDATVAKSDSNDINGAVVKDQR